MGLGELEIEGRIETIQTTADLRSARILSRVLETWGDLLSPRLQWKTIIKLERVINKKKREPVECCPDRTQTENQRKRKERKELRPCQRTKKPREYEGNGDTYCNRCTWNRHKRLLKGAGKVGNRMSSQDHPNYDIDKIGQNSEKRPGDLRRFDLT